MVRRPGPPGRGEPTGARIAGRGTSGGPTVPRCPSERPLDALHEARRLGRRGGSNRGGRVRGLGPRGRHPTTPRRPGPQAQAGFLQAARRPTLEAERAPDQPAGEAREDGGVVVPVEQHVVLDPSRERGVGKPELPRHVRKADLVTPGAPHDLVPPRLVEGPDRRGMPPQHHRALGQARVCGKALLRVPAHLFPDAPWLVETELKADARFLVEASAPRVLEDRNVVLREEHVDQPASREGEAGSDRPVKPETVVGVREEPVGQDLVDLRVPCRVVESGVDGSPLPRPGRRGRIEESDAVGTGHRDGRLLPQPVIAAADGRVHHQRVTRHVRLARRDDLLAIGLPARRDDLTGRLHH